MSVIHQFEAVASHPKLGWMVVFFPGRTYAEAIEEADKMMREEFPDWVFTLTGESD